MAAKEFPAVKQAISALPDSPGIYKFFDEQGKILYIGKAKNLKKRVSSYFSKNQFENRKTYVMVSHIRQIDFTLVDTEADALLLENSLIKEFKPRYNINLKDDKTYPFIRITRERFPRIFPTRNPVKDGSEYFGPYASVRIMHLILDMLKGLYPTRNCTYHLSEANIKAGKFKRCMEYQIGNCKAPCEGLQSEDDYMQDIAQIKKILKGNIGEVLTHLKSQMAEAAVNWKFELAAKLKQRLELLENYQSRSMVAGPDERNVEVFGMALDEHSAFVNYLRVANGMIIQSQNFEMVRRLGESTAELLSLALAEIRNRYPEAAEELIMPELPDLEDEAYRIIIPKSGDKKKLLDLSMKNAGYYQREKQEQYEKLNPELRIERLLKTIQKDLGLKALPHHMECFDNSNIQGNFPVSAMVCFRDGKPAKKDYRHFNIRTVEGPNDFASMKEVITRRYAKLLEEEQPLPQLIVVDGGKGQLSSAVEALKELGIYGKTAIIGIAKRLEEIYYPEDPLPLHLDKKSETLKILQHMRDEAHRFGITHHRKRREKGTIATGLTDIPGIGSHTAAALLRHFGSVKKLKAASRESIAEAIGKAKAAIVWEFFQDKSD